MHLDELQEKYGAKGLKVLAITNEGRDLVDKFIEETGAKAHGIVIEEGDSANAFEIKGFPTAYLIAPDGKIVAAGHPSEAQIEAALASVRLAPELPPALKSLDAPLKKEKYAEARGKLQKLIEGGTLPTDDDKKAATDLLAWIDWMAQSGLDQAKALGEKGSWYEASLALEETAKTFKGLPQAVEADTQLKAMLADKAKKDEITAMKRLIDARAKVKEQDLKPKEALPLYRAIAKKYEDTKAGRTAKKLADELEAALK